MSRHRSLRVLLLQGTIFSALTLPFATAAMAQDAAGNAAKDASEEIVVTGTQIRGITPVGTESVTISTEQIEEAPGITTDDVLSTIPQISNFFNQQIGIQTGAGTANGINTPAIHGLPTLIMLDGHRIAAAGTNNTSIDPSIIPKGILSGIEVVPDGGSALYGSDAIGGVINFTTKKRFDGVDVDGDVGLASGAQTYRLNATVGKAWNEGSIYLSYAFDKQTPLFGRDRPYIHTVGVNLGCNPATVTPETLQLQSFDGFQFLAPAASNIHYNPTGIGANGKPTGFAAGATQNCNEYTNETIDNEQHQHSVFAGWSQDITQSITLDTRAFYTVRNSTAYNVFGTTTAAAGVNVPTTNFYYTPTPAEGAGPYFGQNLGFAYGPLNQPSTSRLQTWGASSTLTADLGHEFQARLLGDFSRSNYRTEALGVDNTLQGAALASGDQATALDPYAPQSTSQSATIADEIISQKTTATGQTDEYQARLVLDGPLFHIPGGDVKIAAGGEVLRDSIDLGQTVLNYAGANNQAPQSINGSRTVASTFGELNIPVIAPDNNVSFIHQLDFSAAGRYDHYSDFGGTFNPRLAASLEPVDWITLRSTWGHSFIAPTLYEEFAPSTATVSQASFFLLPVGDTADTTRNMIVILGGNRALQPEKSKTYTLGGDVKVPFVDGLKFGLTYYHTVFTDDIVMAPVFGGPGALFTGAYNNFFIQNPTLAQAQQFIGSIPITGTGISGVGTTSLAQLYGAGGASGPNSPAYIFNAGYGNNGGFTYNTGLDVNISYRYPTSFGALNFGASGNFLLVNKSNLAPGLPYIDNLANASDFHGTISAGADVGRFHFTADLLHTAGYALLAGASALGQTHISAYNAVNTVMTYTLKGEGFVNGTELRLNIQNLLNARPTVDTTSTKGIDNESVLGRVWELGFHKKF